MRVHSCTGLASKASSTAQTLLRLSSGGASRLAGSPLAGELRCRCVRAVSDVIPPRRLARVELVAEGPHCAVPEVIATTKQGQTVCLSPSAPWVKLLVTRILNSPFTGKKSAWAPTSV
uniref:Chemokine interleukin-8-like domain-containing protein n=2 Tax=Strigidae TaxID=30459 RepID=A0A8D0FI86_STROC